jgi:uncharacterized protein (DUF433 family)
MSDVWARIEDFPDYAVSAGGWIMRLTDGIGLSRAKAGTILRGYRKGRYPIINLWKDKKAKTQYLHRLVARYFVENPDGKPEINHIDGDRSNPSFDNLEWVTRPENMDHAVANSLNARGQNHGMSKLSRQQVESLLEKRSAGAKQRELAAEFGITQGMVSAICRGKNWREIEREPSMPWGRPQLTRA